MLGSGKWTATVTDRGGSPAIMSIDRPVSVKCNWVRDDIGQAEIEAPYFEGLDYASLRTVRHEIVLHRNGVRVWEGPITELSYGADTVTINASDIGWFLSKRALEYTIDCTKRSESAVTVLHDMLRHHYPEDDPRNIGKYLTAIHSSGEAKTAAKHQAYSKTIFDVIDQYAWTGGIDYVIRGRRIIVTDTHVRLSLLPKFTDADFTKNLVVNEYGNQLFTRTVSSNNSDSYSTAVAPAEWVDYYGTIDSVSNSTDEEGGSEGGGALAQGAQRQLSGSYPAPVAILVGEGIGVAPTAPADLVDLMPGAWMPVESTITPRKVRQWFRIDKTAAAVDADGGETVNITVSQTPKDWVDV